MSETDAAPDAARDDEIHRLRRLAFGRTASPADEAAAQAALVELTRIEAELAAAEARAVEARAAAERAQAERDAAALEAEPSAPVEAAPAEPETDEPARWRRWIAPAGIGVAVGALIVGVITVAVPTGTAVRSTGIPTNSADGGATPGDVNYFLPDLSDEGASTDGTIAGRSANRGDLRAAELWFAEPQTAADLDGVGTLLPEYDRTSVRLVHSGSSAKVWVAKRVDGQLCLEVTERLTDYTSGSCALPPDFSERGLTVSSDAITVRWNGSQVNVLLARVPVE